MLNTSLISHDTTVRFELDVSKLDEAHKTALSVCERVFAPEVNSIREASTNHDVYIVSDIKNTTTTGDKLTEEQLLQLSLFSDRATVMKTPLGVASPFSGLKTSIELSSRSEPAQLSDLLHTQDGFSGSPTPRSS